MHITLCSTSSSWEFYIVLMSHRRNSGRQKDEFLVRCDFDDKIGRQGNNQDNSDKHFKLTPEVSQTYVEEKI